MRVIMVARFGFVTAVLALVAVSAGCGDDDAEPDVTVTETITASPIDEPSTLSSTGTDSAAEPAEPGDESATEPFPADPRPDTAERSGGQVLFTDIRVGRHGGFDRVVWEFAGEGTPGWRVEYTDDPREDGSGELVELPGDATLAVRIDGVGIPGDVQVSADVEPYDGPRSVSAADTENVTEVRPGGTFEGIQLGFVGVNAELPFRVYMLEDPTRVVVEVRDA